MQFPISFYIDGTTQIHFKVISVSCCLNEDSKWPESTNLILPIDMKLNTDLIRFKQLSLKMGMKIPVARTFLALNNVDPKEAHNEPIWSNSSNKLISLTSLPLKNI